MTDLHTRFKTLDDMSAPNLWYDIEERAMAIERAPRRARWVLIVVALLLLTLAIGGAVLIGSGLFKLPITVEATATPSATASASATATATAIPSVPVAATWTTTGSMGEARSGSTLTLLADGTVLVAGGQPDGVTPTASAELYDPGTGEWTSTESMTAARFNHTATLLPDGKVLVAGGIGTATSEFFANILASAELYDPTTGSWTATRDMAGVRVGHTATPLADGTVLVAGGGSSSDGDGGPLDSSELYDPSTGRWTASGTMVTAGPGRLAAFLTDGRVIVIGGGDDGKAAELYDPATGQWTATGSMVEPKFSGFVATVLSDGAVLLAGGMAGSGAQVSAELYDPDTGEWTATGDMLQGRLNHTLTLLPDGTVLVAGGASSVIDPPLSALATAERYDPTTGQWTATETMSEARSAHRAVMLPDGTVLVAGGGSESPTSAELYDPGT